MIAFSTLYIWHGGGWLYLSDAVYGWVSGRVTYDRHPRGVVGFVPHDIDSSFRSVHKRTEQTFLKTETNQTQLNKCFFSPSFLGCPHTVLGKYSQLQLHPKLTNESSFLLLSTSGMGVVGYIFLTVYVGG